MFNTPTVFILGAGASWHYGYPTGEELVRKVIEKAVSLEQFFKLSADSGNPYLPSYITQYLDEITAIDPAQYNAAWGKAAAEAHELAHRLSQVNPTLIDFFLKQNEDLHDIGKLVIAMVLLDCEMEFLDKGANPNHEALHDSRIRRGLAAKTEIDVKSFNDDWLRFVLYKLTSRCEDPPTCCAIP